jgi:hypothetical protein
MMRKFKWYACINLKVHLYYMQKNHYPVPSIILELLSFHAN